MASYIRHIIFANYIYPHLQHYFLIVRRATSQCFCVLQQQQQHQPTLELSIIRLGIFCTVQKMVRNSLTEPFSDFQSNALICYFPVSDYIFRSYFIHKTFAERFYKAKCVRARRRRRRRRHVNVIFISQAKKKSEILICIYLWCLSSEHAIYIDAKYVYIYVEVLTW